MERALAPPGTREVLVSPVSVPSVQTSRLAGHRARMPTQQLGTHRVLLPPFYWSSQQRKGIKDRYLRYDVRCPSPDCQPCLAQDVDGDQKQQRSLLGADTTHCLMPDATVLRHFLELLEESGWRNLVLLRSVLDRCGGARTLRRVGKLLDAPDRHWVVLENECSAEMWQPYLPHQSLTVRQDASVLTAARWLAAHWARSGRRCTVVVLTGAAFSDQVCAAAAGRLVSADGEKDSDNMGPEAKQSLCTMSLAEYLESHYSKSDEMNAKRHATLLELYQSLDESLQLLQMHEKEKAQEGAAEQAEKRARGGERFPRHISTEAMGAGVKSGTFYRGHLRVHKFNSLNCATVDLGSGVLLDVQTGALVSKNDSQPRESTSQVLIAGQLHRNRALHGDEVAVELLPRAEWTSLEQHSRLGSHSWDASGAKSATVRPAGSEALRPTGRVVGVWSANCHALVATLQQEAKEGRGTGKDKHLLMIPMDPRYPRVRVPAVRSKQLAGYRVLLQVDEWPAFSKYPHGHYVRRIGEAGLAQTEYDCIALTHSIHHPPFPIQMLQAAGLPDRTGAEQQAVPFSWQVPAEEAARRRDFRRYGETAPPIIGQGSAPCTVMSIDPPGCEDIDDALSVRQLANGNYEIGVHIADVTHFVPYNSNLDLEARSRGTSVYLVGQRLDMLPTVLSTDLCSLRGDTDRLTVSGTWEVEPSTHALVPGSLWLGRAVVHNKHALSYQDAQYIVDTKGQHTKPRIFCASCNHNFVFDPRGASSRSPLPCPDCRAPQSGFVHGLPANIDQAEASRLFPLLEFLLSTGRKLRHAREAAGALSLDSIELDFDLSQDRKEVLSVKQEPHLEFHETIEEFMILANCEVAKFIWTWFPEASLLRRHPFPKQQKFANLQSLASSLGLSLDLSTNKSLAQSLHRAHLRIVHATQASQVKGKQQKQAGALQQDLVSPMWILRILKQAATAAMSEAEYFSTGQYTVPEFFHYGLSADFYTHFTSPIRRYADVVVHHLLLLALQARQATRAAERQQLPPSVPELLLNTEQLGKLAAHLNFKNREAKGAADDSKEWALALLLSEKTNQAQADGSIMSRKGRVLETEAIVTGFRPNGLMLALPAFHVRGAALLLDSGGRAILARPGQKDRTEETIDSEEGDSLCVWQVESDANSASLELLEPFPSADGEALPRRRTFKIFDRCQVQISIRPKASPYRRPQPTFRLVWSQRQPSSLLEKMVTQEQKISVYARQRQQKSNQESRAKEPDTEEVEEAADSQDSIFAILRSSVRELADWKGGVTSKSRSKESQVMSVTSIASRRAFGGWQGGPISNQSKEEEPARFV
eukprot:g37203.t1